MGGNFLPSRWRADSTSLPLWGGCVRAVDYVADRERERERERDVKKK
jgi:hypothetical protein